MHRTCRPAYLSTRLPLVEEVRWGEVFNTEHHIWNMTTGRKIVVIRNRRMLWIMSNLAIISAVNFFINYFTVREK